MVGLFRRKYRVLLHLKPDCGLETIEGVMLGRRPIGGAFVLLRPTLYESDERSHKLEVGHFEVPAANVIGWQVLA